MADIVDEIKDVPDAEFIEAPDPEPIIAFVSKYTKNAENDVVVFVLKHRASGGAETQVNEWDFNVGEDDERIEEIVDDIIEAACDRAKDRPGTSRFTLCMKGKAKTCSFKVVTPVPEGSNGFNMLDGEPREPTSLLGLLGQFMRHNEIMTGQVVQATQYGRDDAARRMRSIEDENDRLRKRELEVMVKTEELISRQWMRDSERDKLDREEMRREKVLKMFSPVLPILFAKVLGPNAQLPAAMLGGGDLGGGVGAPSAQGVPPGMQAAGLAVEVSLHVATLFDSLDGERISKIAEHLTDNEKMTFMAIYEKLREWRAATEAARQAANAGGGVSAAAE